MVDRSLLDSMAFPSREELLAMSDEERASKVRELTDTALAVQESQKMMPMPTPNEQGMVGRPPDEWYQDAGLPVETKESFPSYALGKVNQGLRDIPAGIEATVDYLGAETPNRIQYGQVLGLGKDLAEDAYANPAAAAKVALTAGTAPLGFLGRAAGIPLANYAVDRASEYLTGKEPQSPVDQLGDLIRSGTSAVASEVGANKLTRAADVDTVQTTPYRNDPTVQAAMRRNAAMGYETTPQSRMPWNRKLWGAETADVEATKNLVAPDIGPAMEGVSPKAALYRQIGKEIDAWAGNSGVKGSIALKAKNSIEQMDNVGLFDIDLPPEKAVALNKQNLDRVGAARIEAASPLEMAADMEKQAYAANRQAAGEMRRMGQEPPPVVAPAGLITRDSIVNSPAYNDLMSKITQLKDTPYATGKYGAAMEQVMAGLLGDIDSGGISPLGALRHSENLNFIRKNIMEQYEAMKLGYQRNTGTPADNAFEAASEQGIATQSIAALDAFQASLADSAESAAVALSGKYGDKAPYQQGTIKALNSEYGARSSYDDVMNQYINNLDTSSNVNSPSALRNAKNTQEAAPYSARNAVTRGVWRKLFDRDPNRGIRTEVESLGSKIQHGPFQASQDWKTLFGQDFKYGRIAKSYADRLKIPRTVAGVTMSPEHVATVSQMLGMLGMQVDLATLPDSQKEDALSMAASSFPELFEGTPDNYKSVVNGTFKDAMEMDMHKSSVLNAGLSPEKEAVIMGAIAEGKYMPLNAPLAAPTPMQPRPQVDLGSAFSYGLPANEPTPADETESDRLLRMMRSSNSERDFPS